MPFGHCGQLASPPVTRRVELGGMRSFGTSMVAAPEGVGFGVRAGEEVLRTVGVGVGSGAAETEGVVDSAACS